MGPLSVNQTAQALFRSVPDELWLEMLDKRYAFGIAISGALGGSRSQDAQTRVFAGSYLGPGGARRAPCVIKLGEHEAIERDFRGWTNFVRRQPNRDVFSTMHEPEYKGPWGLLIVDFVGNADLSVRSVAELWHDEPRLDPDIVRRLLVGALGPLHECFASSGVLPSITLSQRALIVNWFGAAATTTALEQIKAHSSLSRAFVGTPLAETGLDLTAQNIFGQLLEDPSSWRPLTPLALPRGAVHGDVNFDNVFVATAPDAHGASLLSLIDFEHCSATADDSPFDDLTKVECELLLSAPVSHAWPAIAYALTSSPTLVPARPLACAVSRERELWDALVEVRRRAADLTASTTTGSVEEHTDGYLGTLLGRALRYIGYAGVTLEGRLAALAICQLTSCRLAGKLGAPRFSCPPHRALTKATATVTSSGVAVDARTLGSYGAMLLPDPTPLDDFLVITSLTPTTLSRFGWIAVGLGLDPDSPYSTGLVFALRETATSQIVLSAISHRNSLNSSGPAYFCQSNQLTQMCLIVTLERRDDSVTVSVAADGSEASLQMPAGLVDAHTGSTGLVVHAAAVTLHSLRVIDIEPASIT